MIVALIGAMALGAGVFLAGMASGETTFDRVNSDLTPGSVATFDVHPLYWLGTDFEGLPLTRVVRNVEPPRSDLSPKQPNGVNDVVFVYGSCTPPAGEGGCAPPLQVQIWPACEVTIDDLDVPGQRQTLRGVPAVELEDHYELQAGSVTIKTFGASKALQLRAIQGLRSANPAADSVAPAEALPPPAAAPPEPCALTRG